MRILRFSKLDELNSFLDALTATFSHADPSLRLFFAAAIHVHKEREGRTDVDPSMKVDSPAVSSPFDIHAGVRVELVRLSAASGGVAAYFEIERPARSEDHPLSPEEPGSPES